MKESGILLHITSLPSKYGIGTLGKECIKFIDYIAECGFSYWEILPLEDTGFPNSPFLIKSPFGHNSLLIDFEELIEEGLLSSRDLTGIDFGSNPRQVDFSKLFNTKEAILKKAYKRFDKENIEFINFKQNNKHLYNYCLYKTIKDHNYHKAWFDFALEDRYYSSEVKEHYERHYSDEIDFHQFLEFIFKKQWDKIHNYAKSKNIEIVGDLPHFLGYDSDAVYFEPELFMVDKRNLITFVAGFPPDNFKPQGQKWGYPLYDWDYMKLNNYKWWKERIGASFQYYDRLKLNHFRGFLEVYAIPFRSKSAKRGKYIQGPGLEFIEEIKTTSENLIASDIGTSSEKVNSFVKKTNLPSMKILIPTLFDNEKVKCIPSEIETNCYYYLGNHNNTPIKTKLEGLNEEEKEKLLIFIKEECLKLNVPYFEDDVITLYDVSKKITELMFASNAEHLTLTLIDLLYKGDEARMNHPGTIEGNWEARFLGFEFSDSLKNRLVDLNTKYNRFNKRNIK